MRPSAERVALLLQIRDTVSDAPLVFDALNSRARHVMRMSMKKLKFPFCAPGFERIFTLDK